MFSGNEWIIVVIVALVLFGGSQIPKLARSLGQAQKEFKTGLAEGREDDADDDKKAVDKDPPPVAGPDLTRWSAPRPAVSTESADVGDPLALTGP